MAAREIHGNSSALKLQRCASYNVQEFMIIDSKPRVREARYVDGVKRLFLFEIPRGSLLEGRLRWIRDRRPVYYANW